MMNNSTLKERQLIVRNELNLEERNIFAVSTSKSKSKEFISTEILPTGEYIKRKVTIGKTIDGIEIGILTTYQQLVTLALQKLWEEVGKPIDKSFPISVYKIRELLKLKDTGSSYKRIKKDLIYLRQIPITFIESFYLKESGYTTTEPFTILDHLKIYEPREKNKTKSTREGCGWCKFDNAILNSLLNNYSHPIRLNILTSFKKHKEMCIKLYLYLDRKLSFQNSFHRKLDELFNDLDLSQKFIPNPARRKQRLQPVIDQLKDKPLSTGIISYIDILKTEDGKNYKLVIKKKPFTEPLQEIETEKPTQETQAIQLINYFHTKFHRPQRQLLKKELQHAISLLEQYGYNKTKYIIDYAIKKAPETNFQMQTFGAVIQYTQEALQRYDNYYNSKAEEIAEKETPEWVKEARVKFIKEQRKELEKRKQKQKKKKERENLNLKENEWEAEANERFNTLTEKEKEEITAKAKAELPEVLRKIPLTVTRKINEILMKEEYKNT